IHELTASVGTQQYGQVYARILDTKGQVLIASPSMSGELTTADFPQPGEATALPGPATELHTPAGQTFLLTAVRATLGQSGNRDVVLQLAFDRTYEENLLAGYRRYLWLVLAVGLAVSALAGYWIARRGLRPIATITNTARRIRAATLNERLDAGRFPAELAALGQTFNEMLDRLEESFRRLSQFSADIAHELRTPVNNLRGEAEVALSRARSAEEYREVLTSCLEEFGRLTDLIDNLLFLARAEHPQTRVPREEVDIGRELATVGEFYDATAADAGVALKTQVDGPVVANLNRSLFQRAVGNLIGNAIAHTPPGGRITLRAWFADGCARVEVQDTGCGIPPEHLPRVFDRFYRVDESRANPGRRVGLGLAIVQSIVHLHGGTVNLTSEVGRGTCVHLSFPTTSNPAPAVAAQCS
ncbi:MAG TPA: heavy metal sensor histidine kinase, partial [Gemmataceae bacterium]|nr:heavy metal sensor histidine kinase [Gemmataceae bacterium]